MIGIIAAALFFGSIAFIAVQASRAACNGVLPAPDGPAPSKPPDVVLIVAAALLGGLVVALGAAPAQIAIAALVVFALVACWCSDMLCGILRMSHARSTWPFARLCVDAAQLGTHLFRTRRLRAVRRGRGLFSRLWAWAGAMRSSSRSSERHWAHR